MRSGALDLEPYAEFHALRVHVVRDFPEPLRESVRVCFPIAENGVRPAAPVAEPTGINDEGFQAQIRRKVGILFCLGRCRVPVKRMPDIELGENRIC